MPKFIFHSLNNSHNSYNDIEHHFRPLRRLHEGGGANRVSTYTHGIGAVTGKGISPKVNYVNYLNRKSHKKGKLYKFPK